MRTCIPLAAVAAVIFGALSVDGRAQTTTPTAKMSAREIFYSAAKATPPRKAKPPQKPPMVKETVKETVAVARQDPAPVTVKPGHATVEAPPKPSHTAPPASEEAMFIKAVDTGAPESPLGLRYSILKRVGPSDLLEVDSDIAFRAGDRIRLRVEANDTGYLYIIHRGSSGVWKPLFPAPEVAGGNNIVEAGRQYDIPHGYVFTFDEQPGEEKLFLVLSRQPEADLEKLIYKLSQPGGHTPAAPPAEKKKPEVKLLLAQNMVAIDDDVVDRLRSAYARDLIIEKVDDSTPGAKKEMAVYAVAPSGSEDSRIVVDVSLLHR